MTITAHPVKLSAGGSVARPRTSRYNNDPRVTPDGGGYTVHTLYGTYTVRPDELGWGIYDTAGGCAMAGIRSADAAIGALLGDAHV